MVVVIICSITIQLSNLARTIHLEQYEQFYSKVVILVALALLFLSYPLLGYIADVCITRYQIIKCSFIILIVGCTIVLLLVLVGFIATLVETIENIYRLDDGSRQLRDLECRGNRCIDVPSA